jgi:hypothetical protein
MTEEELEKAIVRHTNRRKTFMAEGLCEDQAWDLAEQMFERDKDPYDDRRVCFECVYYAGKHCTKIIDKHGKPTMQLRFILQRCDYFKLKGKK